MAGLFAHVAASSVQAVWVIVLVLIIRQWGVRPARWQYGPWLIPMARIILPWSLTSISMAQFIPQLFPDPLLIHSAVVRAGTVTDFITSTFSGNLEGPGKSPGQGNRRTGQFGKIHPGIGTAAQRAGPHPGKRLAGRQSGKAQADIEAVLDLIRE